MVVETIMWSFAVFLASVFASAIVAVTLQPKYSKRKMAAFWLLTAVLGYVLAFLSYCINLYNDTVGILGLTGVVCIAVYFLYEGSQSSKLFVALMACLIANVSTFMFCGTTDTLLAGRLGLIQVSPYEVPNLLFFIGIKIVVYSIIFVLYNRLLRTHLQSMIEALDGRMSSFVVAPAVSVVGFYVINLFTNIHGIYPSEFWFFPLYFTVCLVFVVEFWLIFYAVLWSSRAMKNEAELNVATNIQQSMLPCIFPAFPEREEFDIYATMDPAKEVGGDFYDFFMVDASHLAIVVADVSGKGVPAALFMVIGKTLIKDHTVPNRDLGMIFTEVNDLLCEANSEGLFITAFEGVLDLVTGEFKFVNAGHEMPFLSRQNGPFEAQKLRPGFVLAGMEGMHYKAGSFQLEPGDRIFQYTDGVTEATDAHNTLYGMERLNNILNRDLGSTPEQVLAAVKEDVYKFVGDAPQFDDITMLCLEYKNKMNPKEVRTDG